MMDIKAIWDTLPHRYPLLLVDRVLTMDKDSIHAIKNVTINEEFFLGHFPGNPIMPGVLILEALAQAGGIHALATSGESHDGVVVFLRGIDGAKFRRPVVPGDQLSLHATLLKRKRDLMVFDCKAVVAGELVAEAQISAVVERVAK